MPPNNPFLIKRYNHIFNELYDPLCRFCYKMVYDKDTAEDIVQDQFAYLWEHWDRLNSIENISSYLYKAVRNKTINYLVKKQNHNTHNNLHEVNDLYTESECPSPQELLEKENLEKLLEQALEKLPEKCKNIFVLKRFGELSNKEIAEKLNISVKTVEAQTTIAMKRLKNYITDHWELSIILTVFFLEDIRKKINFL